MSDPRDWRAVILSRNAEKANALVSNIIDKHGRCRAILVNDGVDSLRVPPIQHDFHLLPGISPFVYARNANIGIEFAIRTLESDFVILIGDDCEVVSEYCFDNLCQYLKQNPGVAAVSAGIEGDCFIPSQVYNPAGSYSEEPNFLSFVCVAISKSALWRVGYLDERFVHYGCEDIDWCWRARQYLYSLGTCSKMYVKHCQGKKSEYRSNPSWGDLMAKNNHLFMEKWGKSWLT